MHTWISCFSIGFAMFLVCATQAAPRNKFLTGDGKLTDILTLKDGQGGFVGITGSIWTVRPDGSWDRQRFINVRMNKPDQQGELTDKQLQAGTQVANKEVVQTDVGEVSHECDSHRKGRIL